MDSDQPVIVAVGMSNQPPDVMTMDAGYWSEDNATGCLPHGQLPPPKHGPIPRDADAKSCMARKLRCKKGSRICAQRKAIVEPVNGQIKEARGLRRFVLWAWKKSMRNGT